MGTEGMGSMVADVAASPVEMSVSFDGSSPAMWLIVGAGLVCLLWGRKIARLLR